ncbi:MFS transporter [Allokutzneria albata]|uniref:Major Facilitator Superfamily protein n=1 Tax=Allokutzneria albata TaxID=211114 RepID=A0A1H0C150_ALLAB|nr:MFS transporter [Allokutzneria albata]SDN51567.1 Major Facilitator Superfamily protein [Allokutzneria albata]
MFTAGDPALAAEEDAITVSHCDGELAEGSGVRGPDFRRLFSAWSVSLVGDGVRAAALPLYVAVSTGDPLAASAVAAAELLPWLLVALPAGALVDRWRPRKVVLTAHVVRAVLTAVLALVVFTGQDTVIILAVLAFLLTTVETFADSASQLLLVEIAGPTDLDRANSRFVTAETIGVDLAGPLAASLLFVWEPAACFALDALSFAIAAWYVAHVPDVVPHREQRDGESLVRQVVEGVRYLVTERSLRVLVLAVVLCALSAAAVNVVSALYAIQVLGFAPALVPTLMITMAVGILVAARLTPALGARVGEGPMMIASLLLIAAGFAVLATSSVPGLAWLAYFVTGLGSGCWNVLSATRRQRLTPGYLLGRVSSGYRVLAWGLMPVGAALAGPIAGATSLRTVLLGAAVIVATTAVVLGGPLLRTGGPGQAPRG